jgi:hypothetical protein
MDPDVMNPGLLKSGQLKHGLLKFAKLIPEPGKSGRLNPGILKSLGIGLLMAMAISSCELLDDCKTCHLVTTVNGVETSRGPGLYSCDDTLAERENYSETVGNVHTYWDCY